MDATFFFKTHQHKGEAFLHALLRNGYERTRRTEKAGFVFLDFLFSGLFSGSGGRGNLRPEAKIAFEQKIPIFLYPHSFSAALPYDLEDERLPTKAFFVPSKGFAEILARLQYPSPAEIVGWSYSDVLPFQPFIGTKPRILFAPLHPVGGELVECEREINLRAFHLLIEALEQNKLGSLTVRYYDNLETNGLYRHPRVDYVPALLNGSTGDLAKADLVVSAGTFAYMAVAMGKPTILIGQDIRPHNSPRNGGELVWVKNWELYKDLIRFPFSIEIDTQLDGFLSTLMGAGVDEPADWKATHIGEPFSPDLFIRTLKRLL